MPSTDKSYFDAKIPRRKKPNLPLYEPLILPEPWRWSRSSVIVQLFKEGKVYGFVTREGMGGFWDAWSCDVEPPRRLASKLPKEEAMWRVARVAGAVK